MRLELVGGPCPEPSKHNSKRLLLTKREIIESTELVGRQEKNDPVRMPQISFATSLLPVVPPPTS